MLRLSLPNVDEAGIAAIASVLRSGQLVHGEQGSAFERELQEWIGVRHAILVSSGTAALHLALLALDVGPGDAVLVPDFTFPATANAVALVGARPVLVDVDARSYCITPQALATAIETWRGPQRLRAVMPVHEFGYPVDIAAMRAIAAAHALHVIEDAACAIGAIHAGAKTGLLGSIGCFSMHPRKTLTTGEGGILTTGDDALALRLRRLRNHGIERGTQGVRFVEPGFNYRLTDFQATLGRAQLPHLQGWIDARRGLAQQYSTALAPLAARGMLVLPASHPGHSWQTYMVVLADGIDRDAVIARLAEVGIEANLGAQCISALDAYAGIARESAASSNAWRLFTQGLALPFCEQYGGVEVAAVVAALGGAITGPDA
jgi:perosamine synthetase